MKKTLFVLATLSSLFVSAQTLPSLSYPITADNLKFSFQSYDGETNLKCKPNLENELSQDWIVLCASADGKIIRTYSVHLWVKAYTRQVAPKLSLEVLYWVNDISKMPATGSSSTIWFHLKDSTSLQGLQLSQGVENDTAGLWLELNW
jgi:hypothetical protein